MCPTCEDTSCSDGCSMECTMLRLLAGQYCGLFEIYYIAPVCWISTINQKIFQIRFAEILIMLDHTTRSKNKHMTLKINFLTCFDFFWLFLTFFWLLKTFKEGALQIETTTHLIWATLRAYWILDWLRLELSRLGSRSF